jgi:hypothetical protein
MVHAPTEPAIPLGLDRQPVDVAADPRLAIPAIAVPADARLIFGDVEQDLAVISVAPQTASAMWSGFGSGAGALPGARSVPAGFGASATTRASGVGAAIAGIVCPASGLLCVAWRDAGAAGGFGDALVGVAGRAAGLRAFGGEAGAGLPGIGITMPGMK